MKLWLLFLSLFLPVIAQADAKLVQTPVNPLLSSNFANNQNMSDIAVGAPFAPGFLIFSPEPFLILRRLAWMFA